MCARTVLLILALPVLSVTLATATYAGDGDDRCCPPCDQIDESISPMETYQVVEGSTVGQGNEDYAYSFCTVQGGFYRFTFCEGGGWADFDTELSVHSDSCGGQSYACNHDYCGIQSQLDFCAPYAGQFIVVVCGRPGAPGDFCLAYRGPSSLSRAEHSDWGRDRSQLFLDINRPNPFTQATRITYTVPGNAPTLLTVYDAAGRRVRTLVNTARPAGLHSISWDGVDAAGKQVDGGIYFYRLSAGGEATTKRMLLIR